MSLNFIQELIQEMQHKYNKISTIIKEKTNDILWTPWKNRTIKYNKQDTHLSGEQNGTSATDERSPSQSRKMWH